MADEPSPWSSHGKLLKKFPVIHASLPCLQEAATGAKFLSTCPNKYVAGIYSERLPEASDKLFNQQEYCDY
jgi:hypothetical protein